MVDPKDIERIIRNSDGEFFRLKVSPLFAHQTAEEYVPDELDFPMAAAIRSTPHCRTV
jgi:hypothetical protein